MTLAISVDRVSKSFGENQVLKSVSLNVPQNSVYGFLGNNGAGKSTLIRTILGLLKADSGSITINSKPMSFGEIEIKKDIGCLVDSPCLYLQLTPKEFLGISARLKKLKKVEVQKSLEVVNMQSYADLPMSKFSLGMKQRIAIANALIGSPKLLILDEPTNGLDPQGMQEIRNLLKDLPNRIESTVFLSSHLLDEIEKTASHVGILHHGEIKIESSLNQLLKNQSSSMTITGNDSKKLEAFLLDSGFSIKRLTDQKLSINNIKKTDCSLINKKIIDANFELIESRFNQPSLENLFLNLVKDTGAQND